MLHKIIAVTLVASLFVGCGEGEFILNDGTGQGLSGMDVGEGDEEDESGEGGEFEPIPHDDDLEDPDPEDLGGRVIWSGEENGDLIVHATISDHVTGLYENAAYYAMRIMADGTLYLSVMNSFDHPIDELRLAKAAEGYYFPEQSVEQVCFPFPFLPPFIDNCTVYPCPWDEGGFPGSGEDWPNCIEVGTGTGGGALVQMVGAIDGTPFGSGIGGDLSPYPIFDAPLTGEQTERLERVSAVVLDFNSLKQDIEPLGASCLECLAIGSFIAGQASKCVLLIDVSACVDVYWSRPLLEEYCSDACG